MRNQGGRARQGRRGLLLLAGGLGLCALGWKDQAARAHSYPPTTAGPLPPGARATKVLVLKQRRALFLLDGTDTLKQYRVALGLNPVGAKQRQGDYRTPEGRYTIDYRNARSAYYRSLHISYPNAADRARAKAQGVDPGGDIMIHGLPNGQAAVGAAHTRRDWTWGCIAVTNEELDELWRAVPLGTPIELKP